MKSEARKLAISQYDSLVTTTFFEASTMTFDLRWTFRRTSANARKAIAWNAVVLHGRCVALWMNTSSPPTSSTFQQAPNHIPFENVTTIKNCYIARWPQGAPPILVTKKGSVMLSNSSHFWHLFFPIILLIGKGSETVRKRSCSAKILYYWLDNWKNCFRLFLCPAFARSQKEAEATRVLCLVHGGSSMWQLLESASLSSIMATLISSGSTALLHVELGRGILLYWEMLKANKYMKKNYHTT